MTLSSRWLPLFVCCSFTTVAPEAHAIWKTNEEIHTPISQAIEKGSLHPDLLEEFRISDPTSEAFQKL